MTMVLKSLFVLLTIAAVGHCFWLHGLLQDSHAEQNLTTKDLNSSTCLLCIDVIKHVKQALDDQQLQTDLKDVIEDQVCPLLHHETLCKAKVSVYGTIAVKLISLVLEPKSFCRKLTLCGDQLSPNAAALTQVARYTAAAGLSRLMGMETAFPADCKMCVDLATFAWQIIGNKGTEAHVAFVVGNTCYLLPPKLTAQCKSFMQEYALTFVKMFVVQLSNPCQLCISLGLCDKQEMKVVIAHP